MLMNTVEKLKLQDSEKSKIDFVGRNGTSHLSTHSSLSLKIR